MKKGQLYHIYLSEERAMPFGVGIVKACDTLWTRETIYKTCVNSSALDGIKGVNGIHIIKSLSGDYLVNQISGYTADRGMFCLMVNHDGTTKNVI